jgi:hypothetical protein
VSLTASPAAAGSTGAVLSWSVTAGTLLDAAVDQGVSIVPTSGSVVVTPSATTSYELYLVTEEGGATASTTVTADTQSATPATTEQPLTGAQLVLRAKPGRTESSSLAMRSIDHAISVGGGNQSVDDPVLNGGDLHVISVAGNFDSDYVLRGGWQYIGGVGANRGYKWKGSTSAIRKIVVRPRKVIQVSGRGAGLGLRLDDDPNPVDVLLTIGGHRYWMRFGGTAKFRAHLGYRAKRAPAPDGCAP